LANKIRRDGAQVKLRGVDHWLGKESVPSTSCGRQNEC
jgi:hypothetical protein